MNSAVVTHLFHDAGAASAAMDPAEGAECRCGVPRRREAYVQQWILQRVQSASAECCRAKCHAGSENSVLSYLETGRPRISRIRTFRIPRAQVLLPFAVP